MLHMPEWLRIISILSLGLACASALCIVIDLLAGHRQHMMIMSFVWPLTALYAGPVALLGYFTAGRSSTEKRVQQAKLRQEEPPGRRRPMWQAAALGATHCGSGCTLGDLCAGWLLYLIPFSLFGSRVFAEWTVAFVLAFLFGIIFQYFTIKPMRDLSFAQGVVAALKADALSLTAWQVGMYGWMAVAIFAIFERELHKMDPVFWFMMQLAMIAGFLLSYPVNYLLITKGLKERM